MTSMFIFTGGAVSVLLVSFIVAEVRDAARTRRFRWETAYPLVGMASVGRLLSPVEVHRLVTALVRV